MSLLAEVKEHQFLCLEQLNQKISSNTLTSTQRRIWVLIGLVCLFYLSEKIGNEKKASNIILHYLICLKNHLNDDDLKYIVAMLMNLTPNQSLTKFKTFLSRFKRKSNNYLASLCLYSSENRNFFKKRSLSEQKKPKKKIKKSMLDDMYFERKKSEKSDQVKNMVLNSLQKKPKLKKSDENMSSQFKNIAETFLKLDQLSSYNQGKQKLSELIEVCPSHLFKNLINSEKKEIQIFFKSLVK
jgi:hypothetical protein